ncbi:MAG: amidohydrolase family protein [Pyrinomonadaceae bacterium]
MKNFILRFSIAIFAFLGVGLPANAQSRTDTYAITNAQVILVSGPSLSRATIIVRDGLIESVGENVKVPADARVIDGTGLTVYPGLFDTYSSLGIPARPQGQQAQPTPQSNSNFAEGLRAEETVVSQLRAGEAQFEANRNAGFTTVLTASREGVFNGQSAVINLAGETVSAMVVRAPFAQHITFRTLPGGVYPTSLMGSYSAFRQMLLDAKRLGDLREMYEKNPRGMKRPPEDLSLEALIPVVSGAMPVVMNANSENEIVRAIDMISEFKLKGIIAGGQEAWKVADRLKKQDIPVLLSLNFPKRTAAASTEADSEPIEILRLRAETPKGAARLKAAGVTFAFQSGGMTNISDFLANAAKTIENGLDKVSAIRAMTLSAAEILGVENRLGSIETGKIANLVVVRGDIFAKDKVITQVFVDGKMFEPKQTAKPTTPTIQPGSVASVGGSYNITVEIPGQPLQGTLNLIQQSAILTGTWQIQQKSTPIKDGKVTAEGFSFSATIEFEGNANEITVTGKVTGNQISGTISTSGGAIPFSGTKIP